MHPKIAARADAHFEVAFSHSLHSFVMRAKRGAHGPRSPKTSPAKAALSPTRAFISSMDAINAGPDLGMSLRPRNPVPRQRRFRPTQRHSSRCSPIADASAGRTPETSPFQTH